MINFLIVTGIVIIMAWLIAVYRLDQKKSNLLMVIGGIVCIALFVYTKDWQTALICIIGSVVAAFCFPKSKNMWEMFGMKRTIIYPIQLLMIALAVGTGVGINTVYNTIVTERKRYG